MLGNRRVEGLPKLRTGFLITRKKRGGQNMAASLFQWFAELGETRRNLRTTTTHAEANGGEADHHQSPGGRLRNRVDCEVIGLERVRGRAQPQRREGSLAAVGQVEADNRIQIRVCLTAVRGVENIRSREAGQNIPTNVEELEEVVGVNRAPDETDVRDISER